MFKNQTPGARCSKDREEMKNKTYEIIIQMLVVLATAVITGEEFEQLRLSPRRRSTPEQNSTRTNHQEHRIDQRLSPGDFFPLAIHPRCPCDFAYDADSSRQQGIP
jgi:hypothetical protein